MWVWLWNILVGNSSVLYDTQDCTLRCFRNLRAFFRWNRTNPGSRSSRSMTRWVSDCHWKGSRVSVLLHIHSFWKYKSLWCVDIHLTVVAFLGSLPLPLLINLFVVEFWFRYMSVYETVVDIWWCFLISQMRQNLFGNAFTWCISSPV